MTEQFPSPIRSRRGPEAEGVPAGGSLVSLRARVLGSYLILFVVFGFALVTAIVEMDQTQERLALLKQGYLPLAREIGSAGITPLGLRLEAGQVPEVLYGARESEKDFINLKRKKLEQALAAVQLLSESDYSVSEGAVLAGVRSQIEDVLLQLNSYEETHTAFVQAVEQKEPAQGFIADLLGLQKQVDLRIKNIDRRVDRRVSRVVSMAEEAQRSAPKVSVSLSALAFAIGFLLLISTNSKLRPIRQLIAGAERIREGSFDERVSVQGRDDIGRLARSFNAMAASLEERDRKLQERSGELERALSDLRTSQETVVRSARLATIGQMAAQIAHEVRNPLNALGLNVELLVDEVESGNKEVAKELIEAIRNEIVRLTEVTEAYLAMGRLPPLRLDACDLSGLVEELMRFQGEELERSGVKVDVAIPDGLPEVQVDAGQLRQALLNILRNAVEAMNAADGGSLRVTAGVMEGGVVLEIGDDGPGMDAELVSRIFDPFFSTKDTGSGLGLPITHQVSAEHGGRIECRSTPGDGTTFSIWLPCTVDEEDRSA
ncbi:MAG: ATP-binding protein [Myxococcota bacterium]|nr:ATP-binding protein [Myxococcota bacterium]